MGPQQRATQRRRAAELRAAGHTWPDIADQLRRNWPNLNARAAIRIAHGITQRQAADRWNRLWPEQPKSDRDIGIWEIRRPGLATLGKLARIYECAVGDLLTDIDNYRHLDTARRSKQTTPDPSGTMDSTDRRDFTKTALAALAGVATEPLRALLDGDPADRGPDRRHVALVETAIGRIEARDADLGANRLRIEVAALQRHVADWLARPHQQAGVADDLTALNAELTAWAGWLAFDADEVDTAATTLHEAIVQARLVDDPATEVQALSYLCLVDQRRAPRRALHDAEAALRLARGWGTPRLHALLHLRAARAHAALGERRGFGRELAHGYRWLEAGDHDDDPAFVGFVSTQEARGIAGAGYLALGDHGRAEREFQAIVDDPDPAYRRNSVYYRVRLAQVAADRGAIADAATTGLDTVALVAATQSDRTRRLLADLAATVDRSSDPAGVEFVDAYRTTFGS